MYKIIIVEDEKNIREELQFCLTRTGYQVESVLDFENVEKQIKEMNGHLILLDIALPNKNGFQLCKDIRRFSKIPIIFVTSKTNPMDELNGIMLGGDDYVQKPYNIPILLARISSLLQRSYSKDENTSVLEYKNVELDFLKGVISFENKEAELSRNELKILYYMFKNPNRIVPRADIIEYLWDNEMFIDDNTLSVNITRIREKLASIGVDDLIHTKRGQGYKL